LPSIEESVESGVERGSTIVFGAVGLTSGQEVCESFSSKCEEIVVLAECETGAVECVLVVLRVDIKVAASVGVFEGLLCVRQILGFIVLSTGFGQLPGVEVGLLSGEMSLVNGRLRVELRSDLLEGWKQVG
jgi:hypothetical protein